MKTEQRKRAIRRRRRRQQQIKRRILYVGIITVTITAASTFVSLAAARRSAEPAAPTVKTVPAAVQIVTEPETESEAEVVTETPIIGSLDYDTEDAYILTKMAMAEAEGEDTEGKALVILVILNRVWSEQFPDTIREVVTQENAFTSYSDGRYDWVEPDDDCLAALRLVENHWNESQWALYFERTPAPGESTWHSRNLEKLFTHGNHTFYREKEVSGE